MPSRSRRDIDVEPILPQEWERLRPHLHPDIWIDYYDVMWATGMRPSEALSITRDDIESYTDGEGRTRWRVHFQRLKGGARDVVPVTAELAQRMLARTSQKRKRPFPRTVDAARLALIRAARKAGVRETIHPHLFRHGFGRRMLKQEVNMQPLEHLQLVAGMMGHKQVSTTMRYIRPGRAEVEEAWGQLDREQPAERPRTESPRTESPRGGDDWLSDARRALGLE